jgi:glucan phosphoethanolaminetransferase (alkaline phosphatase superfamily)
MLIRSTQYAISFAQLLGWLIYFLAFNFTSSVFFASFTAIVVAVFVLFISQLLFDKFSSFTPVILYGKVYEVNEVKPTDLEIPLIYIMMFAFNFLPYLIFFYPTFQPQKGSPLLLVILCVFLIVMTALLLFAIPSFFDARLALNPFFYLFGYKCYRIRYAKAVRATYFDSQEDIESWEITVVAKGELRQEDLKYFDMEYLDLYKIDDGIYFLKGVKSSLSVRG